MRRAFVVPIALALIASNANSFQEKQKDAKLTFEQAAKEEVRLMATAADLLATVKDKKTADAAIVKFKVLGKKVLAAQAKFKPLGEPTEEERRVIEKKLKVEIDLIQKRLIAEGTRVFAIEGGVEVLKELKSQIFPRSEKKSPPKELKSPDDGGRTGGPVHGIPFSSDILPLECTVGHPMLTSKISRRVRGRMIEMAPQCVPAPNVAVKWSD